MGTQSYDKLDLIVEMIEAPLGRPLSEIERINVSTAMTEAEQGSAVAKVALSSLLGNAADWPETHRLAALETFGLRSVYREEGLGA